MSEKIGLKQVVGKFEAPYEPSQDAYPDLNRSVTSSFFDDFHTESEGDPLSVWSKRMGELTKLSARTDVAPVFSKLQSNFVKAFHKE